MDKNRPDVDERVVVLVYLGACCKESVKMTPSSFCVAVIRKQLGMVGVHEDKLRGNDTEWYLPVRWDFEIQCDKHSDTGQDSDSFPVLTWTVCGRPDVTLSGLQVVETQWLILSLSLVD